MLGSLILLLTMAAAPGPAKPTATTPAASLCDPGETVVFSCRVGKKFASACAMTPSTSQSAATVRYRFGKPGAVELSLPAADAGPGEGAKFSSTAYSGGGEAHLRFANGAYDYIVFERTVRTGFGPEGNNPEFSAGVIVRKSGKTVAALKCREEATFDSWAYDQLPREEFDYLDGS